MLSLLLDREDIIRSEEGRNDLRDYHLDGSLELVIGDSCRKWL